MILIRVSIIGRRYKMNVVLTKDEALRVQDCIDDNIDAMEQDLKSLTEPDERYEYNDLLQEIQWMRALKEKFNVD